MPTGRVPREKGVGFDARPAVYAGAAQYVADILSYAECGPPGPPHRAGQPESVSPIELLALGYVIYILAALAVMVEIAKHTPRRPRK